MTFDKIVFLWERLALLSTKILGLNQESQDPSQHSPTLQTLCRWQHLERLWLCIGVNQKSERWAKNLKRIYEAEFVGLYVGGRERFKERKRLCQTILDGTEDDLFD